MRNLGSGELEQFEQPRLAVSSRATACPCETHSARDPTKFTGTSQHDPLIRPWKRPLLAGAVLCQVSDAKACGPTKRGHQEAQEGKDSRNCPRTDCYCWERCFTALWHPALELGPLSRVPSVHRALLAASAASCASTPAIDTAKADAKQ